MGGSGGQISVSWGGAGAASAAGGQVDLVASAATAFGGSVIGASELSIDSPGDVGTVCAHSGGAEPFPSLVPDSVFDQSGSPFCIGSAGSTSSLEEASVDPLSSAAVTGTVFAHTGVVSRVGTAVTGSLVATSGGVDCSDSGGSVSKPWSV